jgi:hypothetical protein
MNKNEQDELPEKYLNCLPTEDMRQLAKMFYKAIKDSKSYEKKYSIEQEGD